MKTYPREKILDLCRELGHDPEGVGRIVIEPGTVTVEHYHPITDRQRDADTTRIG